MSKESMAGDSFAEQAAFVLAVNGPGQDVAVQQLLHDGMSPDEARSKLATLPDRLLDKDVLLGLVSATQCVGYKRDESGFYLYLMRQATVRVGIEQEIKPTIALANLMISELSKAVSDQALEWTLAEAFLMLETQSDILGIGLRMVKLVANTSALKHQG